MMLGRYMYRELRRRPGRTVLTLLGIVIGVQSLLAIPLTIETTRRAQRELFEGLTGKADLEVVAIGQGGFPPELGVTLERVNGVEAAIPVIQSTAAIWGSSGPVPVMTLGVDMRRDAQVREYVLTRGSRLDEDGQVLLADRFAKTLGLEVGDVVRLLSPCAIKELRLVGLLAPRGAAAVNAGAVAVIPLATAQQLYDLDGRINSLNLVLSEGADPKQVERQVSTYLPAGLTVQTPAARAALARETLASTEKMLAVLSIVSLVAGAFVILNSFLMSVGERRHTLAILRSLGATRRQVSRLLLTEAVALGCIGTVVGIPVGVGCALAMTHLMAQMSGSIVPHLRLAAGPLVLAALLGPGVAMLATYFPARDAGRRPPLAELQERPTGSNGKEARPRRWSGQVGVVLLMGLLVLYAVILTCRLPNELFVILLPASMVLALVGSALAIPMALGPLSRLAERLLQTVLGTEAGLAMRQLRRHPTRTALVVGVLMISVMLSTGFGNAILNSVRDTRAWMVRVFANVDFLVIPTALSGTELLPVAMPEAYADRIGEIEGVRLVGKGSVFSTRAAGYPVTVFSRTCRPGEDTGFRIVGGIDAEVQGGLRRGEVVIGTALAQRAGVGRGDEISIETREGARPFKVAGLTADYTAGGMVVLIEWNHAKQFFDLEGVRYVYVVADPGDRAGVERRLQAFCDEHDLLFHSRAGFTRACDEMIGGVVNSAWVLLALVFVVASLGITNCLTMNVLEQTRELGVLRAIAMTRRQISKMILAQALAIGVISAIPGALLGTLLGYAMNSANQAVVGINISYTLELSLLIGCVGMALVVAVLASLPPAHRAGRLTIIRALRYE